MGVSSAFEDTPEGQFLTSKRRTLDQLPGLPAESLARTRHHMVRVGSVLVLKVEGVTVCCSTKGEAMVWLSSIWIV